MKLFGIINVGLDIIYHLQVRWSSSRIPSWKRRCLIYISHLYGIARVFRRDSPPTRRRRGTGNGGESSSMLTSVEGNVVQGRMLLTELETSARTESKRMTNHTPQLPRMDLANHCSAFPGLSLLNTHLDVTVIRCGAGEVRVVAGRALACRQVWRGMQYKEECLYSWTWDVCLHWKQTNDWSHLNFHEWTWPTTAQLFLDCHV
jgi:hypothetical protein